MGGRGVIMRSGNSPSTNGPKFFPCFLMQFTRTHVNFFYFLTIRAFSTDFHTKTGKNRCRASRNVRLVFDFVQLLRGTIGCAFSSAGKSWVDFMHVCMYIMCNLPVSVWAEGVLQCDLVTPLHEMDQLFYTLPNEFHKEAQQIFLFFDNPCVFCEFPCKNRQK